MDADYNIIYPSIENFNINMQKHIDYCSQLSLLSGDRHVLSQAKQLNNNFLPSRNMVHPESKLQGRKDANIIQRNILHNSEISTGIESKCDRRLPRLFVLFVVFVASVIREPMVSSSSLS